VAGVGDGPGERHEAEPPELFGRRLDEQPDLPVPGVVAEGDGGAVVGAEAAVGGEDEEFGPAERGGVPAHADVLGPAEQVAAGGVAEQVVGERQPAGRSGGGGDQLVDGRVGRFDEGGEGGGGHGGAVGSSGLA